MKNLNIILSFLIIVSLFSCKNENNFAGIQLNILNGEDTQLIVEYMQFHDTIESENGIFKMQIPKEYIGYFGIYYGDEFLQLYSMPDYSLTIDIDYASWLVDCKIEGKGSEINNYLVNQSRVLSNHEINNSEFIYSASQIDYILAFEDLTNQLNSNLNRFESDSKNDFEDFIRVERKRIDVIMNNMRINYGSFIEFSEDLDNETRIEYYSFIDEIDYNDEDLSGVPEFINLATSFIDWKMNDIMTKDTSLIETYEDYTKLTFDIVDKHFENSAIYEYLYYSKLMNTINYLGIDNLEDIYAKFIEMDVPEVHKLEIDQAWGAWDKLSKGQPGIDFRYPDVNGKMHSLSDYKGKVVYVDVWATWCGPCRQELPSMKILADKFKDTDLVIIGVSVDDDSKSWKEVLDEESLPGIQLFTGGWDTSICSDYLISSIPRFILIDKEGNIVISNAPRPSDNVDELISKLLK